MSSSRTSWFAELRRRRVFRAAGMYLAAAWVAVEVTATVVPLLDGPDWVPRLVLLLAIIAFPVALVLSWVFDWTRGGLQRTSASPEPVARSRRGSLAFVAILLIVVGAAAQATYSRVRSSDLERSIAVLPFASLGSTEEGDYFSDGLTEEILTTLAHVGDLRVISRGSIMQYKGTEKPMRQIARELGVTHVLTGAVRRDGTRIRVSAQLVRATTDDHVWAEQYDSDMSGIFEVQTDIAQRITGALEMRLTRGERRRIASRPTENQDAYELYLRGREYVSRGQPDANTIAINFYMQATGIDPGFATAHGELANAYLFRVQRFGESQEWLDSAVVRAQHALTLDPENLAGIRALGAALTHLSRYDEARAILERGHRLSPNDGRIIGVLAFLSGMTGDVSGAIRWLRRAQPLDPANAVAYHGNLSLAYSILNMPPEAGAELRAAFALQPDFPHLHFLGVHNGLLRGDLAAAIEHADRVATRHPEMAAAAAYAAAAYLFRGDTDTTRALLQRAYMLSPASRALHDTRVALGAILRADGETADAEKLFQEFLEHAETRADDPAALYDRAVVAAARGRVDDAVHLLEQARAAGFVQYQIVARDPLLNSVREDPRTGALLAALEAQVDRMRREVVARGIGSRKTTKSF